MLGRRRLPTLCRYGAALLLFGLAATVSLRHVVAHPGSRVAHGVNDSTGTIRDYWAASVQHRNPFTFRHDALIGAPDGLERAPATVLANGGVQTAFVWESKGALGLVGAWNAFLFLGLLATGLAMFAFLDRLGCTFTASLFGGYVFAFSPYALERAYAGHLGLLHNWVFVLLAGQLLRLRRRRSLARGAAVGGAIAVAFYLSAYQGLLAAIMAFVFFAVELARLRRLRDVLVSVGHAAAAYAVTVLALVPILVFYARERSSVQAAVAHDQVDVYRYAAVVSSYFLPSPRNPLFHWVRGIHSIDLTEQALFFGYTTGALALTALVLLWRRDPWLRTVETRMTTATFCAALVPAAFLVSLPPRREIGGVSLPMPSSAIGLLTSFWRVYARIGLLVGFGLAVLAAIALTALAGRPGRRWRVLAPAALAVVVLELAPGNVQAFDTRAEPGWVAWLASQPRGIVATYPIDLLPLNQQDYWYQKLDGDPRFGFGIFSGVSAVQYSREQAIRLVAHDLADSVTAGVLATEGVRYVVVHDDFYLANHRGPPTLDPRSFHPLRRFGSVRIFAVRARRLDVAAALATHQGEIATLEGLIPPAVSFASGFNEPEQYNGATSYWLIQDGKLELGSADPSTEMTMTGFAFSNQRPRVLEVEDDSGHILARQTVSPSEGPLELGPFPVPHGSSSLTLVAVPGPAPLGSGDPREASVFLSAIVLTPSPVYASRPDR